MGQKSLVGLVTAGCINCEFADPGGNPVTVKTVDCHNSSSDRFTPERDHICRFYYRSTGANRLVAP